MTTDELLAQTLMEKPETDEGYLNIDWETREITLPDGLTNIGVYNDKDTNRLYFRCPVRYGEFQIADFGLRVNFLNVGVSGSTTYDGDVYIVDDAEIDGDYMTFSWLVGRRAYLEEGTTMFIACCRVINAEGDVVNELNTTVAILPVLRGLETEPDPGTEYPDYIAGLAKWIEEVTFERVEDDLENFQELLQKAFDIWFEDFKETSQEKFYEWFENLEYVLDGDVAGHLEVEIEEAIAEIGRLRADIVKGTVNTRLKSEDNRLLLTEDGRTILGERHLH